MDTQKFIAHAARLRRDTRDPVTIQFLDFAVVLAQKTTATAGKFDRNAYQREYMRKKRAAEKAKSK